MKDKRRILYATSGTVPGWRREAMHADQVARALSRWYDLDILCPMIDRMGQVAYFHGARLLRVPLPTDGVEGMLAFARAVQRQLLDGSYEVVHVRSPVEGEAALEARRRDEFVLVYEPSHPSEMLGFLSEKGTGTTLDRLIEIEADLVESCDVLVVHGSFARAKAGAMRRNGGRIVDIPSAVDQDMFDRVAYRRSGLPTVLVTGPAPFDLPEMDDVAFHKIGNPWGTEGWRPCDPSDLQVLLNGSDLVLTVPPRSPRWFDDTPFALIEAISCLRPVLAPDLPSAVEILGVDAGRFLYDPGRPDALADAIRAGIDQAGSCEGVLAAAAERVRRLFPASALRRRLLAFYAGMVPPVSDMPVHPPVAQ